MTPADRRISELIDKWLASIDLHLQYVELSDAAYARVQPWPRHDRPTRWVLEVARQKILELKSQCETRQAMGDSRFSESLELMAFLANLVGIQHIQRFIPLADAPRAAADGPSDRTVQTPALVKAAPPPHQRNNGDTAATRETSRLKGAVAKAPPVAALSPFTSSGPRVRGRADSVMARHPGPRSHTRTEPRDHLDHILD